MASFSCNPITFAIMNIQWQSIKYDANLWEINYKLCFRCVQFQDKIFIVYLYDKQEGFTCKCTTPFNRYYFIRCVYTFTTNRGQDEKNENVADKFDSVRIVTSVGIDRRHRPSRVCSSLLLLFLFYRYYTTTWIECSVKQNRDN